jgi:hypothetical protein
MVRRSRIAGKGSGRPDIPDAAQTSELRLVPISEVKPSPENEKLLYNRIREDDPDVIGLARSIIEHGLKEPLVLTLDYYILSGHRRCVASKLACLKTVQVRFEPIRRGDGEEPEDPRFLVLLREYNRQRVKTFDETVREEALTINPTDAHRVLLEHRKKRSAVSAEVVQIDGETRRAAITAAKFPLLNAISRVLEELKDFWPLTDRQIHYNLLNNPPLKHARKPDSIYRNDAKSYKALCELLTRARLAEEIPFDAIEDPTRPVEVWNTWDSVAPFLRSEMDVMFKGYSRNLLQSQYSHIEIVGEKNTVKSIIEPVAQEFCIPYTIGRGYSSLDPRKKMYDRFMDSGKDFLIILVLSDFDAEGEDIPHSFARSMRDDFSVELSEVIKVALTYAQVQGSGLHPNRLKDSSSRARKFRERYGNDTYELEAIQPQQLQQWLRNAIDSVLDVDAFNREVEREKQDAAHLEALRRHVARSLPDIVNDGKTEDRESAAEEGDPAKPGSAAGERGETEGHDEAS